MILMLLASIPSIVFGKQGTIHYTTLAMRDGGDGSQYYDVALYFKDFQLDYVSQLINDILHVLRYDTTHKPSIFLLPSS